MWILYGLSAALASALFVVLTKKGLESAKPAASLGVQAGLSLLVALAYVGARGEHRAVADFDRKTWLLVAGSGLLIGVAALLRVTALSSGPAAGVAALDQMTLVFTAVFAALFLSEEVNWRIGLGLVMMVAGALTVTFSKSG